MKWEDYQPTPMREEVYRIVDVECPNCGTKLHKRIDIILTSNPPKYYYECPKCNWTGINY